MRVMHVAASRDPAWMATMARVDSGRRSVRLHNIHEKHDVGQTVRQDGAAEGGR